LSQILILDTETTGITEPELVEAAWLEITSLAPLLTGQSFYQQYRPSKPIELGAMATHHIMDEDLIECPPSMSFALPSQTQYLIGHNIDFDAGVIGQSDNQCIKRICTLALARRAWPELGSHTQSALMYLLYRPYAREKLKNAHNAQADVLICASILKYLLKFFQIESIEQLYSTSEAARIPTHMPFGKHKGDAINALPSDYVRWLLNQADVDPYLRQALEAKT